MNNTYNERLKILKSNSKLTKKQKEIIKKSFDILKDSKIIKRAKKQGKFPDFILKSNREKIITSEFIKNKTVVFTFFRGSWCPYCKLEILEYEKLSKEFKKLGVPIIAISYEKIEFINESILNKDLIKNVIIVEDDNSKLAKELKINFTVDNDTLNIYKEFNINLEVLQNNKKNMLPLPATYIVKNNEIVKFFASEDYTDRIEPLEILKILKEEEL